MRRSRLTCLNYRNQERKSRELTECPHSEEEKNGKARAPRCQLWYEIWEHNNSTSAGKGQQKYYTV